MVRKTLASCAQRWRSCTIAGSNLVKARSTIRRSSICNVCRALALVDQPPAVRAGQALHRRERPFVDRLPLQDFHTQQLLQHRRAVQIQIKMGCFSIRSISSTTSHHSRPCSKPVGKWHYTTGSLGVPPSGGLHAPWAQAAQLNPTIGGTCSSSHSTCGGYSCWIRRGAGIRGARLYVHAALRIVNASA